MKKNNESIYQTLASVTGQSKTDLLLARLYFVFDYAEMYDLEVDADMILDWYSQELKSLEKQPLYQEAA